MSKARRQVVLFILASAMPMVGARDADAQAPPAAPAYVQPGPSPVVGVPPTYVPPGVYVPPPTPYRLGVYMDTGALWWGGHIEYGAQIASITPGMPAYGRLDPGDIILRINGRRVYSPQDAGVAIASSGGVVNLRVRDVRTGQIMDIPPIYLTGGPPIYGTMYAQPTPP